MDSLMQNSAYFDFYYPDGLLVRRTGWKTDEKYTL